MSAEPAPKPDDVDRFVDQFMPDYRKAETRADHAMETTATAGWAANYKAQRGLHEQRDSQNIKAIASALDSIRSNGTTDELEKEIKDAVKDLAEERIRYAAWDSRAVSIYRRSCEDANNAIKKMIDEARVKERENPLMDRGFTVAVVDRTESLPRFKWDEDLGQVVRDYGR